MKSAIRPARVLEIAAATCSRPTAPFREGAVLCWIEAFVAKRPHLELRRDHDWNVAVRRRHVRPTPAPLVLAAHLDHPGFHALGSRPRRARFAVDARFQGGVRREHFPGARVRFFTPEGEVPARVRRVRAERATGDLRVVLEARRAVSAGALGMWDLPPFRRARRDPDLLETRVADDLAGVSAVLSLLDAIDRIDPRRRVDVAGLFTRAEEVGFVGAISVARARRIPRAARIVAIEASKALPEAPQGAGPILRVGDRTSIFDDDLSRWIARVGAALAGPRGRRFRWQRKLMDGGTCESTAFQRYGYRCAAMCLPLGNYHNMTEAGGIGAESIRLGDLVGLVRFFEGMVERIDDAPRPGARDPLRARLEQRFAQRARALRQNPFSAPGRIRAWDA